MKLLIGADQFPVHGDRGGLIFLDLQVIPQRHQSQGHDQDPAYQVDPQLALPIAQEILVGLANNQQERQSFDLAHTEDTANAIQRGDHGENQAGLVGSDQMLDGRFINRLPNLAVQQGRASGQQRHLIINDQD